MVLDGNGNRGSDTLVNVEKLSLKDLKKLKSKVDKEIKDRKTLYKKGFTDSLVRGPKIKYHTKRKKS